jgi:hypothetical protein
MGGPLLPGETRPVTPEDLLEPQLEAFAQQCRVIALMAHGLLALLDKEDDLALELRRLISALVGD